MVCNDSEGISMSERITVTINTKDRVEYLLITLSSLLSQTYQEWDLILCDASKQPVINDERVHRLLVVFKHYGHNVRYEVDSCIGIPQSYQRMMELAKTELVIRQEDDVWFEPEMIEQAYEVIQDKEQIAAVGFMTPNWGNQTLTRNSPDVLANGFRKVPSNLCPHLGEIYEPTDQQEIIVSEDKIWNVCTIHGGSLYRKSAALKVGGFCTHFSPTGHREETLFYCRLYFAGYELKVRSSSRLWHFESIMGGSRPDGAHADTRQDARRSDESKFQT
jgi:GT2 family glycosyltransferase